MPKIAYDNSVATADVPGYDGVTGGAGDDSNIIPPSSPVATALQGSDSSTQALSGAISKAMPAALAMINDAASSDKLSPEEQSRMANLYSFLSNNIGDGTIIVRAMTYTDPNQGGGGSFSNGQGYLDIAANDVLDSNGNVDIGKLADFVSHEGTHIMDEIAHYNVYMNNGGVSGNFRWPASQSQERLTENNAYTNEAIFDKAESVNHFLSGGTVLSTSNVPQATELSVQMWVKQFNALNPYYAKPYQPPKP